MDDSAVVLEQVDLINSGDSVNTQSLEGSLQFLVVSDSLLVDNLYKIIRFRNYAQINILVIAYMVENKFLLVKW